MPAPTGASAAYRAPDFSRIPDGMFLTEGRVFKEWQATNFRSLEDDGFRVRVR
jgi:hypothetical protein